MTSGGKTKRSKEGKKKAIKPGRRDQSSLRSNKLKRPHSRSSEESGNETVSKRTRQSHQPIEIADKRRARDKRSRSRVCIEDMSDEEGIDDKTKAKRAGKMAKGTRISSRLQKMYQQDSDEEEEEKREDESNVKTFYGKPTRPTRQQKISSDEEDGDYNDLKERHAVIARKRGRSDTPQITGLFLVFCTFP